MSGLAMDVTVTNGQNGDTIKLVAIFRTEHGGAKLKQYEWIEGPAFVVLEIGRSEKAPNLPVGQYNR